MGYDGLAVEKQLFLERVKEIKSKKNYSYTQMWKEINEHYEIPEGTFDNAVNKNVKYLNPMVVIAFCKTFGYDIYDIYRDKSEKRSAAAKKSKITEGEGAAGDGTVNIDPALPVKFYGTFHGYFFNSQEKHIEKGSIDRFTLNVQRDEIAMLWRHIIPGVLANNIEKACEFSLKGRVVHNQGGANPNGMIVMSFNSEKDDVFCTIAYSKFACRGSLYFRRGALLIQHRGGEIMPMIQSFILTDKEIDLEDEDKKRILQGALTLTNKNVFIEKKQLDKFMDSELLTQYFDKISYDKACREYVELDEDIIQGIDVNEEELYRTLLNIKAESINSNYYVFPEMDHSWRYMACLCDREEPLRE